VLPLSLFDRFPKLFLFSTNGPREDLMAHLILLGEHVIQLARLGKPVDEFVSF
jgi:hypothetical protein